MNRPRPTRLAAFLSLGLGLALGIPGAAANDLRFSATLEKGDLADCGLPRLSSDQVAVIDALVRRDTLARGGTAAPAKDRVAAAVFSQRLTADERRTAGLTLLSPAESARLDAAVERYQNARLARTLLAPPTFVSPRPNLVPTERKKEREIHGSFSLSYGIGSGGYSEKSGSMTLQYENPEKGFAVSVGYTETHTKGGVPYYLTRDPLRP
ncbi:MAG: hypothetical protein HZC55_26265 [Verrucomicrobia bacterium]|nr:hypothetical protein [Verrucomicrobiota bacterium]